MIKKMPSRPGRDDEVFVKLFVSAYENFAWAGSNIDPLDQRIDGAVEALVSRSDGTTLAIEHTLIEPFVGDKRDFASFEKALLNIEKDTALPVPDHGIIVYVPVGSLEGKKPAERRAIVDAIHNWIRTNRLRLQTGEHKCPCIMVGAGFEERGGTSLFLLSALHEWLTAPEPVQRSPGIPLPWNAGHRGHSSSDWRSVRLCCRFSAHDSPAEVELPAI
jgi:hypothetical protein